jgi:anti-sigma regulatory factor (Ser/Thr protein kinase)
MRLVARPPSVPAARRFVHDALAGWGREAFAEEVSLCVSELATNATLHSGSSYFHLELEHHRGAVRVAVADAGMGPVDLLARQPELSGAFLEGLTAEDAAATGRGMYLVSVLADAWGVDELPGGKRVWAEFHPDASGATDRTEAHDDNIAEYTRELQLLGDRLSESSYQRLASTMHGYVAEHAPNWDPAKIMAREAVREGRELVDIDVTAPRDIRGRLQQLRDLLWEAEALSRAGKLMTLPAPEPVQRLRDWLEAEFLAQIEDGAAPVPYPEWTAGAGR